MIRLIAEGVDIWDHAIDLGFRNFYIYRYVALPINVQFTERGVTSLVFFPLVEEEKQAVPF